MYLKVIACEVIFRELAYYAALSSTMVDLEFIPQELHNTPEELHRQLQQAIERAESESQKRELPYDAIFLGYGLCSNAIVGLSSKTIPLVIPRAHDCITFFLGSKERYLAYFNANPGTYYYTVGWLERGRGREQRKPINIQGLGKSYAEYVRLYGEENAKYLMEIEHSWEQNYHRAAYIHLPNLPLPDLSSEAKAKAKERNLEYAEVTGDEKLLRTFFTGVWADPDFLVVPPGQTIAASYDETIIKSTS